MRLRNQITARGAAEGRKIPQKKAGRVNTAGMPLRHIGNIVIWEGNYKSDTLFIGIRGRYLNKKSKPQPTEFWNRLPS
jgi:hypothetical protein